MNKKILLLISIIILLIVSGIVIYFYIESTEENTKEKSEINSEIAEELQISIGMNKDELINHLSVDDINGNYLTLKDYNLIYDYNFLTTYIFENDKLIAIINEANLDNSQRYNLAVEFQSLASILSSEYELIEIDKKWFNDELKNNVEILNSEIINDNLELNAILKGNNSSLKIIASGVNYFNFLSNKEKSLIRGNMILIESTDEYINELDKLFELLE